MQDRPSNYWDKYNAMLIYVEELVLMKDSRDKRECGFFSPGTRLPRDCTCHLATIGRDVYWKQEDPYKLIDRSCVTAASHIMALLNKSTVTE
jgi:hypothetical protein